MEKIPDGGGILANSAKEIVSWWETLARGAALNCNPLCRPLTPTHKVDVCRGKAKLCIFTQLPPATSMHPSLRYCNCAATVRRGTFPLECQLKGIPLVAFANSASSSSLHKFARVCGFRLSQKDPKKPQRKTKTSSNVISGQLLLNK